MGSSLGLFASAVGLSGPLRLSFTHSRSGNITTCEMNEPFAIAGRWQQCSIRLQDPSVSKRHVYLQLIDGNLFYFDMASRTGLRIDGRETRSGWLNHGEMLRLGAFELRLLGHHRSAGERPLPTANTLGSGANAMALSEVGNDDSRFALRHPLTILGRDKTCNLRIDHKEVSLFHAAIFQAANRAWLIDLYCGTTLNGRPVRCAGLNLGDRIGLKHTSFEVQLNRSEKMETSPQTIPMPALNAASDPVVSWRTVANDPVSAAIAEMGQQSMMMTQVFMKMQQEQMALMKQQMELIQELVTPFRNQPPLVPLVVADPALEAAAQAALPSPATQAQVPQTIDPSEAQAIEDAHFWFMSKIGSPGK